MEERDFGTAPMLKLFVKCGIPAMVGMAFSTIHHRRHICRTIHRSCGFGGGQLGDAAPYDYYGFGRDGGHGLLCAHFHFAGTGQQSGGQPRVFGEFGPYHSHLGPVWLAGLCPRQTADYADGTRCRHWLYFHVGGCRLVALRRARIRARLPALCWLSAMLEVPFTAHSLNGKEVGNQRNPTSFLYTCRYV